jgi:methyl-accepting chemotaxis protein
MKHETSNSKNAGNFKFLSEALTAHARWKTRLVRFADGTGERIDPDEVCRDDRCPLGRWIHGEGRQFSTFEGFDEMRRHHAQFHLCAGDVTRKIIAGDKEGAERELSDGASAFNRASHAVGEAIHRFKKALANTREGWFRDMSISTKLAFVIYSLIATLLFHVVWVVNENYAKWRDMESAAQSMKVAIAVGETVHRLQIERGLTSGYVQSRGERFAGELPAARAATDKSLENLKSVKGGAMAALDTLDAHRKRVSGLGLQPAEAAGWYTAVISTLLGDVAAISNGVEDVATLRMTAIYAMFMAAKERAGQERALLTAVYTAGRFDAERYASWRQLLGEESTYLSVFSSYGLPEWVAALKGTLAGGGAMAVETYRRDAQAKKDEPNLNVNPDEWFKAASARIDALHKVENAITADIHTLVASQAEYTQRLLVVTLLVGIAVSLVLGWMSRWIAGGVTEMVGGLTDTIQEVARTGDLSMRVPITTNDEAGRAGKAFNDMLDELQALFAEASETMRATAHGRFLTMNAELQGDFNELKTGVNSAVLKLQRTMGALYDVMGALAAGDFSKRMDSSTEGEVKAAVDEAMQAVEIMLGDVGDVMSRAARGDLSRRVGAEGKGDLALLREDVNRSLDALSAAMAAISVNARQVASASSQTSTAIAQISDGAQNQAHAITQVSNAVRQTADSVTDVSRSTDHASGKSRQTVAIIEDGRKKMERMVEVVNRISANSAKIDNITEAIQKIANKTNLLSLNAAIEAARAGEHGKGFAVVAEEVGKLAASAAGSTEEITLLVQQAVREADQASEAVKEVAGDMENIQQAVRESDGMLQRISAALEQQNAAVQEINTNLANLDRIAESNATASEEITATVVELSKIADSTRREVEKFSV